MMLCAFRVGDKSGRRGGSTLCRGATDDLSLQTWVDLQDADTPFVEFTLTTTTSKDVCPEGCVV